MHHEKSLLDSSDKKPEIIDLYNMTKAGADALDQKCPTYTVGCRTRRWTLAIWFAMIDIAAKDSDTITRRDFLVSLGRDIIKEHLACRSAIKNLLRELRATISRIAGTARDEQLPIPENPSKRRTCHLPSDQGSEAFNELYPV
ncbi:hypothetical protein PR048_029121 [Dryococelus australis]|uniref:PiggyBac transposable element-derived protein domain-containing protein n=1 Tax=Dryococelus australis TaxID=614101 RepID=A0ABQ9GCG9_9NEOP|nr:hypothetical protein PR048_029121 [Dryococelus australis]